MTSRNPTLYHVFWPCNLPARQGSSTSPAKSSNRPAMAQPYPWGPLSSARREIRVLDLAPKSHEPNRLLCDLRVVSIHHTRAYEALSYVWGKKADPPHVLCVGGHHLTITKNLFEALHSLRWDDEIRTLWVDSVCIVQDNNDERSWQVSMMGDIYRNSAMVLVWLGSDDLNQKLIRQIFLHDIDEEKHFDEFPYILGTDLGEQSWWGRAWTLQEAVLQPSFRVTYCSGQERCTQRQFLGYYFCILEHFDQIACCRPLLKDSTFKDSKMGLVVNCIFQIYQTWYRYRGGATDLLRLTLDHQNRHATDPRDKVFAYIGIANSKSVPPNIVQYGLPVFQTMVNTASKLLQNTDTLEVIRHATNPLPGEEDISHYYKGFRTAGSAQCPSRLQGLPSWCPDWTQDIPTELLENMRHYREEMHGRFSAGASHPANVIFHGSSRLGVTGVICDRVIHTGEWDCWSPDYLRDEVLGTVRQWCYMVANSVAYHADRCGGCGRKTYGVWFRCQVCKDFHLCCRCMQKPVVLHAVEHNFSLNYFHNSKFGIDAEDCDALIQEAKFRNTELRSVPEIKVEKIGDDFSRFSGSSWEQLAEVDYPFTGDSLQDAFRRTLLGDHPIVTLKTDGSPGEPLSILDEIVAFAKTWCRLIEARPSAMLFPSAILVGQGGKYNQDVLTEALNRVTDMWQSLILLRMVYTLDRRRLVVSQKGYIGIAPAGTRIGDHICVLHGGEMPFILRQCSVNDSSGPAGEMAEDYVLVGEAYVHGLMHGEAIRAADNGELQRVQMVLH